MLDLPTSLVFFLIVLAASLATYGLGVWNRDRVRPLARSGIAAATLFMLAAAVMVVLLMLLAPLRFPGSEWLSRPMIEPASVGNPPGERGETASLPSNEPGRVRVRAGTTNGEPAPTASAASYEPERASPAGPQTSPRESRQPAPAGTSRVSVSTRSALAQPGEFWGATQCVLALQPDPSDLLRWTLENECGWPVGILVATCSQSRAECHDRTSRSWRYQAGGMILPAKVQRPVTDAEQTAHGRQIRYVACFVTTREAIGLIAGSRLSGATEGENDPFDAARAVDECLASVQRWSYEGNRSGVAIDVLLGTSLPANAVQSPDN